MISSVRGKVLAIAGPAAIIEVGGVGLAVQVTPAHALSLRVGADAFLRTALIVREDDLSLYGFEGADELEVFDLDDRNIALASSGAKARSSGDTFVAR